MLTTSTCAWTGSAQCLGEGPDRGRQSIHVDDARVAGGVGFRGCEAHPSRSTSSPSAGSRKRSPAPAGAGRRRPDGLAQRPAQPGRAVVGRGPDHDGLRHPPVYCPVCSRTRRGWPNWPSRSSTRSWWRVASRRCSPSATRTTISSARSGTSTSPQKLTAIYCHGTAVLADLTLSKGLDPSDGKTAHGVRQRRRAVQADPSSGSR